MSARVRQSTTGRKNFLPQSRYWQLRGEKLETRRLLAGDVAVSVSHGTLFITGDRLDNFVEVFGTGTAGQFVVEGFTDNNGGSTKINHSLNSQTFNGVTNISVALGRGDDFFGFEQGNVAGNFNIDMGDGNDEVNVGIPKTVSATPSVSTARPLLVTTTTSAATICGSLCVNLGSGNNWLIEGSTTVKQSETVTACDGNDRIEFIDTGEMQGFQNLGNGVTVGRDLAVNLGGGSNYLDAYDLTVNGSLRGNGSGTNDVELAVINVAKDAVFNLCGRGNQDFSIAPEEEWGTVSGQQNHVGGNLTVNTGSGCDEVDEASLSVGGSNTINTDGGNDSVTLGGVGDEPSVDYSVSVGKDFRVNLGNGTDSLHANEIRVFTGAFNISQGLGNSTIELDGVIASMLKIATDGGQDDVSIEFVAAHSASIDLGSGNDTLAATGATISTSSFDGGSGVNTYTDGGINNLPGLTKRHFT